MKFTETRIYADPERAARKLVEIASTIEPVQEGRIHIEKINAPFLYQARATPAEYSAGLRHRDMPDRGVAGELGHDDNHVAHGGQRGPDRIAAQGGSHRASEPPEENAELVQPLAEEIQKAADEYQRKMRVVH